MPTIHGVPISTHTRKAIVTAHLKGIAFELNPVIPFDPPAEWRRLSPSGLIPALTDGDFAVSESSAICAYLDRLAPAPALYPTEPRALATALSMEQFATGVLFREVVHPLFSELVIRPKILKTGDPDRAVVAHVAGEVAARVFGQIEERLGQPGFAGTAPGIAEIAVASMLINHAYLGFAIDAGRWPGLAAFLAAMLATGPFRRALADEAPFAAQMGLETSFLAATETA